MQEICGESEWKRHRSNLHAAKETEAERREIRPAFAAQRSDDCGIRVDLPHGGIIPVYRSKLPLGNRSIIVVFDTDAAA